MTTTEHAGSTITITLKVHESEPVKHPYGVREFLPDIVRVRFASEPGASTRMHPARVEAEGFIVRKNGSPGNQRITDASWTTLGGKWLDDLPRPILDIVRDATRILGERWIP